MEQFAFSFCQRDPVLYADMLANIGKPDTTVAYAAKDGVILLHDQWLLMAANAGTSIVPEILRRLTDPYDAVLLHDQSLVEPVQRGLKAVNKCQHVHVFKQVLYEKSARLSVQLPENTVVRALGEADIPVVAANYRSFGTDDAYCAERVRAGVMLGAFVDGRLAGFMGQHGERSMGLLVVLPEYRRHHLAEALERTLINALLEQGALPFGQVDPDNNASLSLQRKIGLTVSADNLYWLY